MGVLLTWRSSDRVSALQGDAWAAWNASYHEPNSEIYRALGTALYLQDWRERIHAQLAKLDEQNAKLDALLAAARGHGSGAETAQQVCIG